MLGELNSDQIERILGSEVVGRIGCHDAGRPYVVPVTYVYDGVAGQNERHALQLLVDRLTPLLPSATAHPGSGAHPGERHAGETTGRAPVLYRIMLGEKTGRFEKR